MIFIDTSAFYALEVEDDVNHSTARSFLLNELRSGKYGILVTSDYVLNEVLTLLRIRCGVKAAISFYRKASASKSLKIVWIDEEVFREAMKYFMRNGKYKWSFTDCTSFAIMKLLGIKYVFTFDKNFEQAGFNKLP